ncbi:hypothetical protein NL676_038637 [Syzygium grande]|nr:hypothetical protein NL676_038637 [Syzygium grande]
MHRRLHQPYLPHSDCPAAPFSSSSYGGAAKRSKKHGSYNCGRCGLPKKGRSCYAGSSPSLAADSSSSTAAAVMASSMPVNAAAAVASSASAVALAPSSLSSVAAAPPSRLKAPTSDVDAMMLACIAFSCPNLESVEISTSSNAVNRITGALRMLSLVLGSEITDASVAAIASSFSDLELLDLDGYDLL